jgi:uncharacterized protein
VCHGACPKDRLLPDADGAPRLSYLCAGYQTFFRHIRRPMALMVEELRQQRPPANVMRRLAQEDAALAAKFAAAKRNDLCPCGSGKKFKLCHGQAGKSME